MLSKPDASITGVAETLSYSSVSHFQTVFKKIAGTTPGEYIKTARVVSFISDHNS